MTAIGLPLSFAVYMQAIENLKIHSGHARLFAWAQLFGSLTCLLWAPLAPLGAVMMLVGTWGIAVHWRGTLNGGSDFMTFHVLAAWSVALMYEPAQRYAAIYISIQVILSYTVAGLAKVANAGWRDGSALPQILERYGIERRMPAFVSWLLIVYELSWPLAFWHPLPWVLTGFCFHLINAYALGLNRFFWIWLAAYPALFMTAG